MPWISDSWSSQFKWRGKGNLPENEKAKLKNIVKRAHQNGQKVRFWAAPDNPRAWAVLHENGVDLINTDQIENLAQFLQSTKTP
jgi:glycerophosphoryl diester phosphodiesterase